MWCSMNNFFVHSSPIIDKNVKIGKNTKIWHFCHVSSGTKIGKNCNIGQNVFVGQNVVIGDNVKIQNNVSVYSGVIIQNDVFIGPSVVFTNVLKPRAYIDKKKKYDQTLVQKGATIGANSTIICGNMIGKFAFVGAGSVVTKNVLNNQLVYGNPAKLVKKIKKKL